MATFYTTTFASGDGVAVQLPPELNIAPDATVWLERVGDAVRLHTVRPSVVDDAEEGRRNVERLVANLLAAGPVGEVERREPIEQPDRPGL